MKISCFQVKTFILIKPKQKGAQPMKKKMTITIDSDMYEWLEMMAHKEHRSVSNFLSLLIRKAFKKHYKERFTTNGSDIPGR